MSEDALEAAAGPSSVGSVESRVYRHWALGRLRKSLAGVPEVELQVLELRYRDGLSAREVARELGMPQYKRVYELQSRALGRLRHDLRAGGVDLSDLLSALRDTQEEA